MSEIEKLMQNAEVEPEYQDCCKLADKYWNNEDLADEYVCFDRYMRAVCPHNQECTDECKNAYDRTIYPEFTAEKQLELICFIVKSKERISFTNKPYILTRDVLANGLAFAINTLWQDLTDTEKAEIKRILE